MRQTISDLWVDDSGQDLMEYALLAWLLVIGALAGVQSFANTVVTGWHELASKIVKNL